MRTNSLNTANHQADRMAALMEFDHFLREENIEEGDSQEDYEDTFLSVTPGISFKDFSTTMNHESDEH